MCHLPRSALTLFFALLAGCETLGGGSAARSSSTADSGSVGVAPASGSTAGAAAVGDARAAVTEILDQYRKALLQKDVATLDRIWADDLSFINYRGQILTKAQRMENVRSGATAFKAIQTTDQVVRPYGDAVVATSVATLEGQYSGEEGSGAYRVTTVWARQGAQWRMVAVHMTKLEK